jgi:hypothetical protein
MDGDESTERWRENMQNAWVALRMIREAIQTLGPPGTLMSRDAVLIEHGPEPVHEAQAIVDALNKLSGASKPVLLKVDGAEQT